LITLPLHPGETVLWVGSPVPGFHRRGATVFLMLFGLPFLIIGVGLFFYGLMQLHKSATMSDAGLALFTAAFALTFGSFGAFLVFGPLIAARTAFRDGRPARALPQPQGLSDPAHHRAGTGTGPTRRDRLAARTAGTRLGR